jgi:hypothetical protein
MVFDYKRISIPGSCSGVFILIIAFFYMMLSSLLDLCANASDPDHFSLGWIDHLKRALIS